MATVPGQISGELVTNEPFVEVRNAQAEDVTLDSATVDSGNSPTTQLRRGLVVGYDSANLNYVGAEAAAVDAHVAALADSAEAPDVNWQAQTLTITMSDGFTHTHTLGSNTTITNLATAITDINTDPVLASRVVASDDGGGLLRLTATDVTATLAVSSSLATAYGGVTVTGQPTLNKYGIMSTPIPSTIGLTGAAEAQQVGIFTGRMVVDASLCFELTAAARIFFEANGVVFVN